MEQIRKQIEDVLTREFGNHRNEDHIDLTVDEIMQLMPQWRTFSEDCKPEVGDWVALLHRGYWGRWTEADNNNVKHFADGGYKFYIIPKE